MSELLEERLLRLQYHGRPGTGLFAMSKMWRGGNEDARVKPYRILGSDITKEGSTLIDACETYGSGIPVRTESVNHWSIHAPKVVRGDAEQRP